MVSGSISLPSPGFFSPFPHGTCSLSVALQYLALDRGRPGFRQGFPCPAVLRYRIREPHPCRLRGFHPLRQAFPGLSAINAFSTLPGSSPCGPTTPNKLGLGSSGFARRYSRNLILISVPALLRWFTSRSFALPAYVFSCAVTASLPPGYPIRPSADHGICAPPRGFSQLVTAFFAPELLRHPP